MDQRVLGAVPSFAGVPGLLTGNSRTCITGEDDRMHPFARVQERVTQRTWFQDSQPLATPVGHMIGQPFIVVAPQPDQAEEQHGNHENQYKQYRYLNDRSLPSRVHWQCMAVLYIVATPIGNLGDITFRAVDVLRTVRAIACEDTRHSRKLLSHFGISCPVFSCRGQNTARSLPRVLGILRDGGDVAYLSDAGTPGISDPGSALVRGVRAEGIAVVPLPGPSAVTTLVSASGIAGRGWLFEGFLPPKGNKRRTRLTELVRREEAFVLYESPHRIGRLMEELRTIAAGRQVVLGRELTKIHEQIVAGTVEEIAHMVDNTDIPARGEFVVLVWTGKNG